MQNHSDPVTVNSHGAEIQQDAIVGKSSIITTENVHPVQSDVAQPDVSLQAAGSQGVVLLMGMKIITTRLAQPVHFNFEQNSTNLNGAIPACHWCDSPVYAVLGLPKMTYRVRELSNHLGYQEVDGGHRSLGYPASRVCFAFAYGFYKLSSFIWFLDPAC